MAITYKVKDKNFYLNVFANGIVRVYDNNGNEINTYVENSKLKFKINDKARSISNIIAKQYYGLHSVFFKIRRIEHIDGNPLNNNISNFRFVNRNKVYVGKRNKEKWNKYYCDEKHVVRY